MMKRTIAAVLLWLLPALALAAPTTTLPSYTARGFTNDGVTGTTLNKLVKVNSSGNAIVTATTDAYGAIGVAFAGAGTSGTAQVVSQGVVSCVFDGTATAGHFVSISSSTAGDCHDAGTSPPISSQLVGVVAAGGTGAGTYTVILQLRSSAQAACGDLSNSSGGCTMSTTAAGDLSGTLPSPTVAKVNGVAYPASPSTDTLPVVTAANTATYKSLPNCSNALTYDTGTHSWGCNASAGTGTVTSVTCNGLAITTSGTCPEPFSFENCSLAASVSSNLLTVSLKDASGSDPSSTSPCRVAFRSATATTGSHSIDSVTGALSISTNATGATLGSASNTAFRFWVVAFDNAGTVVLSLYNATTSTSCKGIDETSAQSSTAISGTATAAQTFYTPNGTTLSSKSVRVLGYVEYNSTGLATAGTYATGPNFIQTYGPGVKRPCDVLQFASMVTTSVTSVTSSSPTSTNATLNITPTRASSLIRVRYSSTARTAAGNVSGITSQLYRGSTAIGVSSYSFVNLAAPSQFAVSQNVVDQPNSTSAQTYVVKIHNDDSTTSVSLPGTAGGGAEMTVEEIMG